MTSATSSAIRRNLLTVFQYYGDEVYNKLGQVKKKDDSVIRVT